MRNPYVSQPVQLFFNKDDPQPKAAMITQVLSIRRVNVIAWDNYGNAMTPTTTLDRRVFGANEPVDELGWFVRHIEIDDGSAETSP